MIAGLGVCPGRPTRAGTDLAIRTLGGVILGVMAELWMRFISKDPQFSVQIPAMASSFGT